MMGSWVTPASFEASSQTLPERTTRSEVTISGIGPNVLMDAAIRRFSAGP